MSLHPLKIDGAGTIIDEWIKVAGGRNAAAAITGVQKQVSIEQILVWDPDVIIIAGNAGPFDPGRDGGLWRALKAVKTGRVARNPEGVFPWDRFGSEYLLQISWAAALLHPELFPHEDIAARTTAFYRDFLNYRLTPDETARILAARPPPQETAP
jgi:iron complex transport system substrate-binding protein